MCVLSQVKVSHNVRALAHSRADRCIFLLEHYSSLPFPLPSCPTVSASFKIHLLCNPTPPPSLSLFGKLPVKTAGLCAVVRPPTEKNPEGPRSSWNALTCDYELRIGILVSREILRFVMSLMYITLIIKSIIGDQVRLRGNTGQIFFR